VSIATVDPSSSRSAVDPGLMVSVAFLLVAVPLVYSKLFFDSALMPKFLALMLGALFVAISWLRLVFRGTTLRAGTLTDLPVICYVLVMVLQWPRALDAYQASLEIAKFLALVTVYFGISKCSSSRHWITWSRIIAIVCAAVSLIGICQYLEIAFLSLPSSGFPSSTFPFRNIAAMFIATAFPFVFLGFLRSWKWTEDVVWAACWTIMAIFLIYTRARGAWVGMLVASILALGLVGYRNAWWRMELRDWVSGLRSRKLPIACVAVVLILAASQEGPRVTIDPLKQDLGEVIRGIVPSVEEVMAVSPSMGSGRMGFWIGSVYMIRDNLFTGVGLTNWEKTYPKYRKPGYGPENRFARRPHNDYLWVFSELGLAGIAAYLAILIAAAVLVLRSTMQPDSVSFEFAVAAFCGLAALQTHAFFSFPRERIGPLFLGWFCLSILASTQPSLPKLSRTGRQILVPLLAIIIIALGTTTALRAAVSEALTVYSLSGAREGHAEQAALYVDQAGKWGAFDYRHLIYQCEVLVASRRFDDALVLCREVVRRAPNSVNGLQNLAKTSARLGDNETSITSYRRAIALHPGRTSLYRDLGRILEKMERFDEALQTYEAASERDSASAWIPNSIADIHLRRDGLEAALGFYRDSADRDAKFAPAYFGLGNVYLKQSRYPQAIESYAKGLQFSANAQAHYALGALYQATGEPKKAIEQLEAGLGIASDEGLRTEILRLLGKLGQNGG